MNVWKWAAIGGLGLGALGVVSSLVHPSTCMGSRVAWYDKNVLEYWNTCSRSVHAMHCSRKVGTDFVSIFDGKDRQSCSTAVVGPKQMITQFYGTDENSSLLRMAVSDSHLWVATCYPPKWPKPTGNGCRLLRWAAGGMGGPGVRGPPVRPD